MYVYVHVYVCLYVYVYKCVCVCLCVCMCISVYVYVYVYVYVCVCVYMCMSFLSQKSQPKPSLAKSKKCKKVPTTVPWSQSVFLLSPFFFSSFLRGALFFFLLFLFIRRLGWQERSERKPRQERKSKIVLLSQRLWKSLPLKSNDPLRWNCGSRGFTGLWCVIFCYLFIYLFEIMKQIVFIFCLPFLFSKNTFLGNTIFFALLLVYHSCLWCVFD